RITPSSPNSRGTGTFVNASVQPSADRGPQATSTIRLQNFRSVWQGVTEGHLERVLDLLKATSRIAVIVDKGDAQLGNRSSSGDSGVGNRAFAQSRRGFRAPTLYPGGMPPIALTIAGSDPSGGAGIQADLKTFHQFGVYGEAVIALLTVQNTVRVSRVVVMPPAL